jgi:uncharacterized membrane protein (DUF485 family)
MSAHGASTGAGSLRARSPDPDWRAIAQSPQFRELVQSRRRFVVAASAFYCAYLLTYLALLGFAPGTMSETVVARMSVAVFGALSLVVVAWLMAWLYARRSQTWARMTERLVAVDRDGRLR